RVQPVTREVPLVCRHPPTGWSSWTTSSPRGPRWRTPRGRYETRGRRRRWPSPSRRHAESHGMITVTVSEDDTRLPKDRLLLPHRIGAQLMRSQIPCLRQRGGPAETPGPPPQPEKITESDRLSRLPADIRRRSG